MHEWVEGTLQPAIRIQSHAVANDSQALRREAELSAHVTRGIGCESCHGRVDRMEEVYQASALTMMWCLDCHRAPEKHLRPRDKVTAMGYAPSDQVGIGRMLREQNDINPPTDCSTCHR